MSVLSNPQFNDSSEIEPIVEFPYDDVARALGESVATGEFDAADWRQLGIGIERLVRWIYQSPSHRNLDGIQIRFLIVAWIVVKELQPLTLTELARMYGKDKQSFGRWVDEFKRRFPRVRNSHMKE